MAMEEKTELQKPNLCEECNINASKYKCPGCSLRSCSLPCVNSHKKRTACTGKRPLTNFIPISQFDDNLLISDYNMLEDVKRIADSAQRRRVRLCGFSHFKLPYPLQILRNAAGSRRTRVLFLPNGMLKRVKNRTYYNKKKKFISWTIEWRFHSTDVVLLDHGIHENSTLSSVIAKHLKGGPWNHPLRPFCEESLDSLKFFIRKYPKGPKSPFCQLNIDAPIREQLANVVILEYPVIHVFLPSHSYDFDVITIPKPTKMETVEHVNRDYPSPKGVTFREEEIEDLPLDPHVSDLLNNDSRNRFTDNERRQLAQSSPVFKGEKWARSVYHNDSRITPTEDSNTHNKTCIEELDEIGDLDFDFETGLIDVYPDLTKDATPDDFLDFDEIISEKDVENREYPVDEELEEGEIA